jgi:hypothetical protein
MPRRNGSYFGLTVNPTPSVASGIWRVREAEEFLRVNKWPATPGVPGSPVGSAGNAQVSLTWSAPTLGTPPTDYHVQYSSNSGSTWTTFADGTSTATSAVVTGLTNGTGYIFRVRAVNALGEGPYGAASGAVTPSEITAALLLHFDGSDGSTTFTDSSGNGVAVTRVGGAQISTTQSKFGGSSGRFLTPGNFLTVEKSAAGDLGQGDFTIEGWIWINALDQVFQTIFTNYTSYGSGALFFAAQAQGTEGYWTLSYDGNYPGIVSSVATPTQQWVHFAIVRHSDTLTLYIDGVSRGSAGLSGADLTGSGGTYFIAASGDNQFNDGPKGYIDEFRIVLGTAVYTEDFTPPTAPF